MGRKGWYRGNGCDGSIGGDNHHSCVLNPTEETKREVAGRGNTNKKNKEYDYPKHLQYAKVPIRDTAQCRTEFFIDSLSKDIVHLKNSNKSSALTWKNIKTIGYENQISSGHYEDTIISTPISEDIHIC